MELNDAINHLKESLADPTHKWGCDECKQEHEQLLEWLDDYKQLKSDYADLDNMLRTANTEIDRLQSVSSWIPCSEKLPEDNVDVLVYDDGILIARYNSNEEYTSGWMESFECYPLTNATHWMPLPATPEVINNVD